jgi:hypothetical protein
VITKIEIVERAGQWNLRPEVVEKDYVLGWGLAAISQHGVHWPDVDEDISVRGMLRGFLHRARGQRGKADRSRSRSALGSGYWRGHERSPITRSSVDTCMKASV